MNEFPRTEVGGLSLPRMLIGTNWFMGYSHTTAAKDKYIQAHVKNRDSIADIMETFVNRGVDAVMGLVQVEPLAEAVKETEQRTGRKVTVISTPWFPALKPSASNWLDLDEMARVLDNEAAQGVSICMPHTSFTDAMVDKYAREIRQMDVVARMIRERGMVPGLSTHMPEAIIYADETGLDVEGYISIFNAMGFLMHVEVDWTASVIRDAKKPVMTIKPMAAGQIRPLQALTFVWNAIRDIDMVTVGTMSPDEAKELIDLSLQILAHRTPETELQRTRSKSTVMPA